MGPDLKRLAEALRERPEPREALLRYARHYDTGWVDEWYAHAGQQREIALAALRNSGDVRRCPGEREAAAALDRAAKSFAAAGRELDARLVRDAARLRALQKQLAAAGCGLRVGEPLCATLSNLIAQGRIKDADALRKEYNVVDRGYARLKLRALCNAGRWADLHQWVTGGRRPPMPYEAVVAECVRVGSLDEASRYAPLVKDYALRAEALCRCARFADAAIVARENDDVDVLLAVRAQCERNGRDPALAALVEQITAWADAMHAA